MSQVLYLMLIFENIFLQKFLLLNFAKYFKVIIRNLGYTNGFSAFSPYSLNLKEYVCTAKGLNF